MKPCWLKMLCVAVTLTMTATLGFAAGPFHSSVQDAAKAKAVNTKARTVKKAQLDINTATEAQLKAIPGIGNTYAAKIIAGRPYAKKDQLKSRKILPGPVYNQVKEGIIAKQPVRPILKK